MLKRLLHQTWALRDNLALQCQYCNTKILTGICSMHHDNRRHMYRIKYSRHVAFDSINNVWMLLFAILNTIFIPWTELEELLNGPLTPSKQTFGFQTPKGHSLSLFIYRNVKHFTVKEKPQFGKSQVFPFSQQTIWTVSMLHSLHEGLDWWKKTTTRNTIPLILRIQFERSASNSEDDTVKTNFANTSWHLAAANLRTLFQIDLSLLN